MQFLHMSQDSLMPKFIDAELRLISLEHCGFDFAKVVGDNDEKNCTPSCSIFTNSYQTRDAPSGLISFTPANALLTALDPHSTCRCSKICFHLLPIRRIDTN